MWKRVRNKISHQGAHTRKRNPHNIWLAKLERPNFVSSNNQCDLKTEILKTKAQLWESPEGDRQLNPCPQIAQKPAGGVTA